MPSAEPQSLSPMLAYFTVQTTWAQIWKALGKRLFWGDAGQLAAQLAYYFTLSLFPGLLCLVAVAALFPLANISGVIVQILDPLVPSSVLDIIHGQLTHLAQIHDVSIVSLGFVAAAWSGSGAMGVMTASMNRAYGIDDARSWWHVRLMSIVLTLGLSIFVLLALLLILAGPEGADLAAHWLGYGPIFALMWKIAEWPLVIVIAATAIRLVYYFAPYAQQCWVWLTPGTILATVLALAGSIGFRAYVVHFGRYDATYGAIGGMIVLLMWAYVTSFALITGMELDAVIERAAPWSNLRSVRIGSRRCIGAEAARMHYRQQELPPTAE